MNRFLQSSVWLLLLALAGCQGEQRESLHEMDHFVPTHWPTGLADAAGKIEDRLATLQIVGTEPLADETVKTAQKELFDIVGWVPEIAADSWLTEAQWVPVNTASLELSQSLQRMSHPLDSALAAKISQFRDRLIEAAAAEAKNRPVPIEEPSEEVQHAGSETHADKEAEQ